MRIFLLILIIAAFVQSSMVDLNLCLILLTVRTLVVDRRENLYLAFFSGILLGLLTSKNIGFYPLFFITVVKLLSFLNKSRITPTNYLIVLPVSVFVFTASEYLEMFLFNQSISTLKIIIELIIAVPVFLVTSLLEDRFILKGGIKLKL